MKKVFIIANPIARRSSKKKIDNAIKLLKVMGYEPHLLQTQREGDGINLTKEVIQNNNLENIHCLIAAGGDGTFNEVANGLVGSPVPMAILPLGTTNVLAKELKIPEDIKGALHLLEKEPVTLRPGQIALSTSTQRITRHFLLMAGIGFDGEAVYGVNKRLKKLSGKLAYILSGAKVFLKTRPLPFEIVIQEPEGKTYRVKGYNAVISKSACYGGYFKMAPHANPKEPALYAVIFTKGDRFSTLRYISGIVTARHVGFSDVIYKKVSRVLMESDRHVQIDGDYLGMGKVEISSGTQELRFLCP